ncbi:Endo-1,4-beta-xylanase A precursor [compost metagenome]
MAWNNPNASVKVSILWKPAEEQLRHPDSLVVGQLADNGSLTPIPNGRYDAANGALVFHTAQFGTYAAAYTPVSFEDLGNVSWAQQAVSAMAARDVIQGTSPSSFSPAASMKRGDFIALLVRALELKGTGQERAAFSDVRNKAYYSKELAVAKQLGIISGYGDNTFQPDSMISRQDMMVIASRALAAAGKEAGGSGTLDAYSDAGQISDYAKDSLAALMKYGIVNGKNGKLAPNDPLTRAEAAVIVYRIWKL